MGGGGMGDAGALAGASMGGKGGGGTLTRGGGAVHDCAAAAGQGVSVCGSSAVFAFSTFSGAPPQESPSPPPPHEVMMPSSLVRIRSGSAVGLPPTSGARAVRGRPVSGSTSGATSSSSSSPCCCCCCCCCCCSSPRCLSPCCCCSSIGAAGLRTALSPWALSLWASSSWALSATQTCSYGQSPSFTASQPPAVLLLKTAILLAWLNVHPGGTVAALT
eukprot:scaffold44364_cov36-Phaeocystis_antarctica.AAC.1